MLLTVSEAATRLGISRTSLYALIHSRGIEHIAHPRGRTLISDEACDAYLEAVRVPALVRGGAAIRFVDHRTTADRRFRAALATAERRGR